MSRMSNKPAQLFLFCTLILLVTLLGVSALPDISCTCPSGYPCSVSPCSAGLQYCSGDTFYDYDGGCDGGFLFPASDGECTYDVNYCGGDCVDTQGCVDCDHDSTCTADTYVCSGNDRYYRDYVCNMITYTCSYSDSFVEDCDDYDGNYCTGDLAQTLDYSCSGVSCLFSVASTLADCSDLDTGYNTAYCSDYYTSTRTRTLGVCDLSSFTYCDTISDSDDVSCSYGCGVPFTAKDYQYDCLNYNTYYEETRDVYGICRIDGVGSFSTEAGPFYCNSNYYCDSSKDNNVVESSANLPNPCTKFNPTVLFSDLNQIVLQNDALTVKAQTTQIYEPTSVCYDETNDGIYEACYTGANWDTVHSLSTSGTIGAKQLRVVYEYSTLGFEDTDLYTWRIVPIYIIADIDMTTENVLVDTVISADDSSVAVPDLQCKCWSYKTDFECYGNSSCCDLKCPIYDYSGSNLATDFLLDTSTFYTNAITLKVFNNDASDSDSSWLCVTNNVTGEYCGTCTDGIKNDDETGIDIGGAQCYDCFNGIQDGPETYIDYGAKCGTCYDGIKQDFESLDVDYGGICGNCTTDKDTDSVWGIAKEIFTGIPFEASNCGESTTAILGFAQIVVLLILFGIVMFLIVILLGFGFLSFLIFTGFTLTGQLIGRKVSELIDKRRKN